MQFPKGQQVAGKAMKWSLMLVIIQIITLVFITPQS